MGLNTHKMVKVGPRWFSANSPIGKITYIFNKDGLVQFVEELTDDEFEIFKKIMQDNKFALLYKDHEVLKDAAVIKLKWKYAIMNGEFDIM